VKAYPPGSVICSARRNLARLLGEAGEYVTQVTATGPLGLEYHDTYDDPRS